VNGKETLPRLPFTDPRLRFFVMIKPPTISCPACHASGTGNFCSSCGASLTPRTCIACQAQLSEHARFCHRCGRAVAARDQGARERTTWLVAAGLCVALVAGIVYKVAGGTPAPPPDMANVGAEPRGRPAAQQGREEEPQGRAPDISTMTPRERFDRLFNRIMQAGERADSAEVRRFTPMALGAYEQLDHTDVDARYHAGVLHLGIGDFAPAYALADTILSESPHHLFGYVLRGTAAGFQGDTGARLRAERDFLRNYQSEMAANRVEYLEHKPVIEEFKGEAEKAVRP
jgi:double zinc ribbon protein